MRNYLIVDDNLAFAENLAEILEDAGHRATIATNGEQALALVGHTRFDALLTDMRMPIMSGAEVVHRMRQIDPGLPAIAITAYTHDDELEAARKEGLLAVLPKPVAVERLVELLSAARRDGVVALVEDDVAFADNLTEILRAMGFSAVTATTVTETERLGVVRPFAALVDLRVPGGPDGEAMRKLAAKYPGLPMIVMTAHLNAGTVLDATAVFSKPFATETLVKAIERIYRARR
jgi:CheY-like chemotaxis protein